MKATHDFETLIAPYPLRVRKLAQALRKLIFAVLPEPLEMIDAHSRLAGYGFGPRYADMVCSLIPSNGGVKLGLAYGASLADPDGLLGGAGKVHRHMNFQAPVDVERPGVKSLLRAALAAQQSRVGVQRKMSRSRSRK